MENELILQSDIQTPEQIRIVQELLSVSSTKTKKLRNTKTPAKQIHKRDGKKGQVWSYIERITAMKWLDEYYPCWSFEILPESFKEYAGYVQCAGKLSVYDSDTSLKRVITCYGQQEITVIKDSGNPQWKMYVKAVETDAFKRCVFTLGGFTDVYTKDSLDVDERSDEDLGWYVDKILPVVLSRYDYTTKMAKAIFSQMHLFRFGEISRQELVRSYKIVEVK